MVKNGIITSGIAFSRFATARYTTKFCVTNIFLIIFFQTRINRQNVAKVTKEVRDLTSQPDDMNEADAVLIADVITGVVSLEDALNEVITQIVLVIPQSSNALLNKPFVFIQYSVTMLPQSCSPSHRSLNHQQMLSWHNQLFSSLNFYFFFADCAGCRDRGRQCYEHEEGRIERRPTIKQRFYQVRACVNTSVVRSLP